MPRKTNAPRKVTSMGGAAADAWWYANPNGSIDVVVECNLHTTTGEKIKTGGGIARISREQIESVIRRYAARRRR